VAVVGDHTDGTTAALAAEVLGSEYRPNVVLAVASPNDPRASVVVPLLRDRTAIDGRPTAYVCERFTCKLPVTDTAALREQLEV
jgi:hypothetical protein